MPFLSYRRASQLRQILKGTPATVITPDQEGYPELLNRWSEASEREAVRKRPSNFFKITLKTFLSCHALY